MVLLETAVRGEVGSRPPSGWNHDWRLVRGQERRSRCRADFWQRHQKEEVGGVLIHLTTMNQMGPTDYSS